MCLACIASNLPQTTYCERGFSTAFLSEPINAFTNIAFLIAGLVTHRMLRKKGVLEKEVLLLPWLLAIVGLGSFLHHTARSPITLVLDALPIYIFILFALFLVLNKLFISGFKSIALLISFIGVEVILSIYIPREFLNGSIRHITALLFISMIGFLIVKKYGKQLLSSLIVIIALYAFAIIFRSADLQACSWLPIGTHFLWHILAATAGGFAIQLISSLYLEKDTVS